MLQSSQDEVAQTPVAHGRAQGVLSSHCLRGTEELGCATSQLLLSAINADSCVDIASKHLSTPQVQESWIFASQKRNLSVTDLAEVNDTVYLTVGMVGKWRHKHWFRPKSNTQCKPGLSKAQLTSYFTLPRKQSRNSRGMNWQWKSTAKQKNVSTTHHYCLNGGSTEAAYKNPPNHETQLGCRDASHVRI